ncbi:MAG TPA: tRNA (adenosine(37)-N6)-dimethylallyltransferase MiaA [Fimbriimonadaceae bacterium]
MTRPVLLAVMGPTSSGKSALAEQIALEYDAQLINADAFQAYRGFDIGTGKPEDRSRYLLLDVADPSEQFGLGEWIRLASGELAKLYEEGRSAVMVGGTGLYIRALMEEYKSLGGLPTVGLRQELMEEERRSGSNALFERLQALRPEAAAQVDRANPLRVRRALEIALSPAELIGFSLPPFKKAKLGIEISALENKARIKERVSSMLERGWIDEVSAIKQSGLHFGSPAMRALGYKQIWSYLDGSCDLEEMEEDINRSTAGYAKRQRTWLRSEPAIRMIPFGTSSKMVAF